MTPDQVKLVKSMFPVADAWTTAYGTLSGFMISQASSSPQAAE
jgi:hemoglobin-like flavoprotein